MNSRYIFAVPYHTLLHGGLGHQPLLCEELVLIGFYWISFEFHHLVSLRSKSLLGNTPKLGLYPFAFASFWCEVPLSVWSSKPKPHLIPQDIFLFPAHALLELEKRQGAPVLPDGLGTTGCNVQFAKTCTPGTTACHPVLPGTTGFFLSPRSCGVGGYSHPHDLLSKPPPPASSPPAPASWLPESALSGQIYPVDVFLSSISSMASGIWLSFLALLV